MTTPAELLVHIEIDVRHSSALDFNVDAAAAETISDAARIDIDIVQSPNKGYATTPYHGEQAIRPAYKAK